jgi:succinate---hydroxymethylglutarate CoA-transferase
MMTQSDRTNGKPLDGIKVLDFTRMFAGPFCTMLLGDLGADVVKVESPEGDAIRHQGPPFHAGQSFSYLACNRNKRSIVLDLKSDADRETARRMALRTDVIVENFRPDVMPRLGLGYDTLASENPGLVYAAISGMGADGPMRDKGAFDLTIQAEGGYMSITGARSGAPVKLGTSAFDLIAGQYAMGGIMTALFQRERTGVGQRIDTSLLESEVTFLVDAAMEYLLTGKSREKWGSEHSALVPYKVFEGLDGWIVIGAGAQNLFERLLEVLGRQDIGQDERFSDLSRRNANRDALYALLDAEVAKWPTAQLLDALEKAKVPASLVNGMPEVFAQPQVLHRGMLTHVDHAVYGRLPNIGPAVKYGAFDIGAGWTAPPLLGEHDRDVRADWLAGS